ncbi:MAG: L,D-transpeptidase [Micrococcales bacterium]|nr:L,D-transpeptidase [Micrococcales bacterium]
MGLRHAPRAAEPARARVAVTALVCALGMGPLVAVAVPAAAGTCTAMVGTVTFDGEARLGGSVRAIPQGWVVDPGPADFHYQWLVGGVVTQSSRNDRYSPSIADAGQTLALSVTAFSPSDASCVAAGGRVAVTSKVGLARFSTPVIVLAGTATASKTLTASLGTFGIVEPQSVTLRWLRDGVAIPKATGSTYTLTGADVGRLVSLRVTAKGDLFETLKVTSREVGPVQAGWFTSAAVKIKGKARVGAVLTAQASGKGVAKPTSFTYQWLRNGKKIKGAKGKTYEVKAKDVGKKLRVKATARRDGFVGKTATSKRTKKVGKIPLWVDPRCMSGGAVLCIHKNPKDSKVRYVVNGKVKAVFDARFGAVATPTREGVYQVYAKDRDCYSTLYDSHMPFAMFFSGGQAVHYSPDFAARGYNGASHGCVNIRDLNGVRKLFDKVKIGTKVVVYS